MKVGFDLDGTLDRPALCALAKALIAAGHEVHVISGCFTEAGDWQNFDAKRAKLVRLGLMTQGQVGMNFRFVVLDAVSHEKFDREYRLVDLGLRKGAYCEANGIELMFDDSDTYVKMMPAMCGTQIVQVK